MIKIVLIFVFLIFLSSCGSVKDGLTLKKKSNADEFLVEKKNPLVLPPDFNKLPIPNEQINDEIPDEFNEVEKFSIEKLDKEGATISIAFDDEHLEWETVEKEESKLWTPWTK